VERTIPITLVVRSLDEGVLAGDPLLFAELTCCDRKPSRLRATVRHLAREVAEKAEAFALHRREMPGEAVAEELSVELAPPKRQTAWHCGPVETRQRFIPPPPHCADQRRLIVAVLTVVLSEYFTITFRLLPV
jgi:hypothetical protein